MRASDTERVTHNPLVANAFFRAGYIESWGRGIEKIRQECLGHDIEPPVYDFGMAGLMLTFHANPEHLIKAGEGAASTPEMPGKTAQEPSVKSSVKTSVKPSVKISGKTDQETVQETAQERILALLEEDPRLTRRRLVELIGISDSGIKYHLDKLKSQGVIRHVGPTKAGHWEIIK